MYARFSSCWSLKCLIGVLPRATCHYPRSIFDEPCLQALLNEVQSREGSGLFEKAKEGGRYSPCRVTSFIRKRIPLGPHRRPMPGVLVGS